MSLYLSTDAPSCGEDFVCAICQRRVCSLSEIVLCACTDDPTCGDCCSEHHGGEE